MSASSCPAVTSSIANAIPRPSFPVHPPEDARAETPGETQKLKDLNAARGQPVRSELTFPALFDRGNELAVLLPEA